MVEEQRAAPERPVRNWGIPLGRVAGVPVFLTASWLVLAVLIMITYQGYLAVRRPELPQSLAYLVGAGLVLSLLVSVLLHELGHALTARRFGIGVRGITLELLGGYTELDRDAPSPAVELLVSLAGPAVSLVLGAVAAAAAAVLPDRTLLEELAFQLALSNLVVAAFNVLPGLPLDGGRALRAGIWALSRDRHLGDRVAGWVGRLVAVASVVFVVLLVSAHVITVFGGPAGWGRGYRCSTPASWPGRCSRCRPVPRWPRPSAGTPRRSPTTAAGNRSWPWSTRRAS